MTGRNDNREQFQKMLRDTAKKQFDTIILWKIDRFGRNREEIAFNKYRCKKNGVNGDNLVSTKDLTRLMKYMASGETGEINCGVTLEDLGFLSFNK